MLVTDNEPLLGALAPHLRADGFEARVARTAEAAKAAIAAHPPGIVVLDVTGEGLDARRLCRDIRAEAAIGLIVLASRAWPEPLAVYLDEGADDFLPNADRLRELVARMRAVLRRSPAERAAWRTEAAAELRLGDVALDRERHEVTVRGEAVALTLKQFQLLELFLAHPGQVLPRATILRRVWGSDSPAASNTLEVQIKRLRRHIEQDPARPALIKTVRGVGYLFADR